MTALYDRLGRTYTATRRADPRIAAAIREALGDARTVVNVGAGTGAYEPTDRDVVAVDPSAVMLAQRPPGIRRVSAAAAASLNVSAPVLLDPTISASVVTSRTRRDRLLR